VGRIAGHLGLSNLIMYYDSNNIQLSTKVDEVDTEDVGAKYKAWGWNVLHVDGQSVDEIRAALRTAGAETERPTIIIGRTVMGKGAVAADGTSYENKVSTHGQPLSAAGADIAATVKHRGAGRTPEKPVHGLRRVEGDLRRTPTKSCVHGVKAQKAVEAEWRSGPKRRELGPRLKRGHCSSQASFRHRLQVDRDEGRFSHAPPRRRRAWAYWPERGRKNY